MSKKYRSSFHEDWGLCLGENGRMTWGVNHGWGRSLPHGLKQVICHVWNLLCCMVCGHDHVDVLLWLSDPDARWEPPKCTYCGTELPVDGKYVTEDMLTKPHWKDVPPVAGIDYPLDPVTDKKTIDALVAKGIEPWTTESEESDPDDPAEDDSSPS